MALKPIEADSWELTAAAPETNWPRRDAFRDRESEGVNGPTSLNDSPQRRKTRLWFRTNGAVSLNFARGVNAPSIERRWLSP